MPFWRTNERILENILTNVIHDLMSSVHEQQGLGIALSLLTGDGRDPVHPGISEQLLLSLEADRAPDDIEALVGSPDWRLVLTLPEGDGLVHCDSVRDLVDGVGQGAVRLRTAWRE